MWKNKYKIKVLQNNGVSASIITFLIKRDLPVLYSCWAWVLSPDCWHLNDQVWSHSQFSSSTQTQHPSRNLYIFLRHNTNMRLGNETKMEWKLKMVFLNCFFKMVSSVNHYQKTTKNDWSSITRTYLVICMNRGKFDYLLIEPNLSQISR